VTEHHGKSCWPYGTALLALWELVMARVCDPRWSVICLPAHFRQDLSLPSSIVRLVAVNNESLTNAT
jgi:hypothetical protein